MVLAVFVLVHLAVTIYAVRGGLTGAEILARTRGSLGWGAFYAIFVVACAVHVPIGLAKIAEEWAGASARVAHAFAAAFAIVLLLAGGRAVWAVIVG